MSNQGQQATARPRIVSPTAPTRQSERLRIHARRIIQERAEQQRAANQNNIDPDPSDSDPSDTSSTISEDSFDDETMSSTQPKGILETMLGQEFMTPIASPTITDAQQLQQTLANLLSTITDLQLDGGFSWIIEERGYYMLRRAITDIHFVMPVFPTLPPYNENATR